MNHPLSCYQKLGRLIWKMAGLSLITGQLMGKGDMCFPPHPGILVPTMTIPQESRHKAGNLDVLMMQLVEPLLFLSQDADNIPLKA